jgi:TIR domain
MRGKIFINYRRNDSGSYALNIAQYLERKFGRNSVFIDIDQIKAGQVFSEVLDSKLAQCKVMLAVIGPQWLTARDQTTGGLRLEDPNDWVRLEIECALTRGIPVVPILVGGAKLPAQGELPSSLRPLVAHQCATITTDGFRYEMAGVADDVSSLMGGRPSNAAVAGALSVALVAVYSIAHQMGAQVWWPNYTLNTAVGTQIGTGLKNTPAASQKASDDQVQPAAPQKVSDDQVQPAASEKRAIPSEPVRQQFARAFGQGGIPALMALQEARGRFRKGERGQRIVELPRDIFPITDAALQVWQEQWPFKNASALSNSPLWTRYSGNREFALVADMIFSLKSGGDTACFLYGQNVFHNVHLPYPIDIAATKIGSDIRRNNKCAIFRNDKPPAPQIGFTFQVLYNSSANSLYDVDLQYKLLKAANMWSAVYLETNTKDEMDFRDFLGDFERLDMYFNVVNNKDLETLLSRRFDKADVVETKIGSEGLSDSKRVAEFRPNESIIMLMNVYIPDENGFPRYYIDDVIALDAVEFTANNVRQKQLMRGPLKSAAAKITFVWGWWGQ